VIQYIDTEAKHETVRKYLQKLIAQSDSGMTPQHRKKMILCVNKEDTVNLEDGVERGCFSSDITSTFFVNGMYGTLPCFLGHTVVWYAEKTLLKAIHELSQEELIAVVESQQRTIDVLWERRQRL
jgi:hypothetical protein